VVWSGSDADLGSGGGVELRGVELEFLHVMRSRLRNLGGEPLTKPLGRLNFATGPNLESQISSTYRTPKVSPTSKIVKHIQALHAENT